MSGRSDEQYGGHEWHEDEKGHAIPVLPADGPRDTFAAAFTRTAGSILLISLMLAAVVFAVAAFLMQLYYRNQISEEMRRTPAEIRALVAYRDELAALNVHLRASRYDVPPHPPAPPTAQLAIDQLRQDNADLRRLNEQERQTIGRRRNPPEPLSPARP